MSIETITEYIDPQLFIVVPMLWGIGMAVKRSKIENRFIPLILLLCSCSVVILYLTSTKFIFDVGQITACVFAAITQGSVIWLRAWLSYEKFLKEDKGDKK